MNDQLLQMWHLPPDALRAELRRLREDAGLQSKQLAELLGWVPPKVTRSEKGQTMPSEAELADWVEACGGTKADVEHLTNLRAAAKLKTRPWRELLAKGGLVGVQYGFNKLAERTTTTVLVERSLVPGLVQTEGYAAAVLADLQDLHDVTIDPAAAAATRTARSKWLDDQTKQFVFVVSAEVFAYQFCDNDCMADQLDALAEAGERGNVELVVMRPGRINVPPDPSFGIYDDTVIVETQEGLAVVDDPASVEVRRRQVARIRETGVSGLEAVSLVRAAAGNYRA